MCSVPKKNIMAKSKRKRREIKAKENYKPEFIFRKKNYTVMGIGLAIVVLGFILMSGGGSDDPEIYNPEIFNWRRIRLAPTLVLVGFIVQVYAILLNPESSD